MKPIEGVLVFFFFLLESYGSFLEYVLEDSLETRFYLHDHFKVVIILRCFPGVDNQSFL